MTGATTVRRRGVPEAIRSLSTLVNPDYVDLFTAPGPSGRSAEQWARAAVETGAGLPGQILWRGVLGLRLDPGRSPDHVGGWLIAGRGYDWIRLEAASSFLTAQIVVHVDDGEISVATFIRYDRTVAAVVWPPVSVLHRRAMLGLLRHAARALARLTEASG